MKYCIYYFVSTKHNQVFVFEITKVTSLFIYIHNTQSLPRVANIYGMYDCTIINTGGFIHGKGRANNRPFLSQEKE